MTLNDNILFTSTNVVENATLECNKTSVTPLDWMRTSKRARHTRWVNPEGVIRVDIKLDTALPIEYIAVPGHNLPDGAEIAVDLLDGDDNRLQYIGYQGTGSLIPAGEFAAGVDPWNTTTASNLENVFFITFDRVADVSKICVYLKHNYTNDSETVVAAPDDPAPVIVSDGILRQDDSSGIVCIEAENCERVSAGSDAWIQTSDNDASGDECMYKSGGQFYWTAGIGPQLKFTFTAAQTGSHKVFLRMKSIDGNSIYTSFDGTNKTSVFRPYNDFINDTWQWKETATVNLVAGNQHDVSISARDHRLYVDKIVIQPSGDSDPSGEGPAESGYGTSYTNSVTQVVTTQAYQNFVDIRMLMAGTLMQLNENFEYGYSLKFLDDQENYTTESGFLVNGKTQNRVRQLSLNFNVMSDRDRRLMSLFEQKQRGKAFIISAFPSDGGWIGEQFLFLGKFPNAMTYGSDIPLNHHTTTTITEV